MQPSKEPHRLVVEDLLHLDRGILHRARGHGKVLLVANLVERRWRSRLRLPSGRI